MKYMTESIGAVPTEEITLSHCKQLLRAVTTYVAHHLNNPLAGILGLSELMIEEARNDHISRSDLETVVKMTLRCKEVINQLCTVSRVVSQCSTMDEFTKVVNELFDSGR